MFFLSKHTTINRNKKKIFTKSVEKKRDKKINTKMC